MLFTRRDASFHSELARVSATEIPNSVYTVGSRKVGVGNGYWPNLYHHRQDGKNRLLFKWLARRECCICKHNTNLQNATI